MANRAPKTSKAGISLYASQQLNIYRSSLIYGMSLRSFASTSMKKPQNKDLYILLYAQQYLSMKIVLINLFKIREWVDHHEYLEKTRLKEHSVKIKNFLEDIKIERIRTNIGTKPIQRKGKKLTKPLTNQEQIFESETLKRGESVGSFYLELHGKILPLLTQMLQVFSNGSSLRLLPTIYDCREFKYPNPEKIQKNKTDIKLNDSTLCWGEAKNLYLLNSVFLNLNTGIDGVFRDLTRLYFPQCLYEQNNFIRKYKNFFRDQENSWISKNKPNFKKHKAYIDRLLHHYDTDLTLQQAGTFRKNLIENDYISDSAKESLSALANIMTILVTRYNAVPQSLFEN